VTATAGGTTSAAVTISISVRLTVLISLASDRPPVEGVADHHVLHHREYGDGGAPPQMSWNYGDSRRTIRRPWSQARSRFAHVYGDDGSFTPSVVATDDVVRRHQLRPSSWFSQLLVSINTAKVSSVTFTANHRPAGAAIASYTGRSAME
jgi:hypothetical protein